MTTASMRRLVLLAFSVGAWAAACAAPDPVEEARRNGRRVYLVNCAPCHGVEADGHGERSEELDPPPRDHTDPAWRSSVTEDDVFSMIADGVPASAMPSWRYMIPDQDLRDVTTYVLSIAERGAEVDGE